MQTHYLWDDVTNTCLAEFDENGDVTVEYNVNPQSGELISERRDGEDIYHRFDGDGNTRQTADSAGNVLGKATYDAFGETVAASGDMKTTYRFRGQQGFSTDPLSGDVRGAIKSYSPSLGRWLTLASCSNKRCGRRAYSIVGSVRVTAVRSGTSYRGKAAAKTFSATHYPGNRRRASTNVFQAGPNDDEMDCFVQDCSDWKSKLKLPEPGHRPSVRPPSTKADCLRLLATCNVNLYCAATCGGTTGITFVDSGYVHICLREFVAGSSRDYDGLLIHECVHAYQYIQLNKSWCQATPWGGGSPTIPPLTSNCKTCKERENQAYRVQAQFLFPKDRKKQDQWVAAGLCFSCGHIKVQRNRRKPPEDCVTGCPVEFPSRYPDLDLGEDIPDLGDIQPVLPDETPIIDFPPIILDPIEPPRSWF